MGEDRGVEGEVRCGGEVERGLGSCRKWKAGSRL
jgi:hypothetical protein